MNGAMKKLIEFARSHPKLTIGAVLILGVVLWYSTKSLNDWRLSRKTSKQDAQIQKSIDQNAKSAEASEANANTQRDARQDAEGRAALAEEQRKQAAENSNLTIEPVRKARQKHEEARKSRPADYPALTDDELCAELAKRGISCR